MDDKDQAAIDALRAAGLEAEAKAVEELRRSHKNTLNAFDAGQCASKAEGIKEGLRRAAALLRNVEWTDAAMATAGFDEQCEDIYSAAILKEIGE